MEQPPVLVSIVLVYDTGSCGPELHLACQEAARTLTPRERVDRLYALGEFAAAAQLLSRSTVN
jgi:hypothetical protein